MPRVEHTVARAARLSQAVHGAVKAVGSVLQNCVLMEGVTV